MRGWGALFAIGVLAACNGSPSGPCPCPSPSVSPTPVPAVEPGRHTGPTGIAFLGAEPAPGATLAGCGADARACAGRVRMTFRLSPSASGHVLEVIGFLHAENKLACYTARSGPRELAAGVPVDVELGFDSADPACRAPIQLTDLAVVVGGTIEVESRQEWALRARYTLQP